MFLLIGRVPEADEGRSESHPLDPAEAEEGRSDSHPLDDHPATLEEFRSGFLAAAVRRRGAREAGDAELRDASGCGA